MRWVELPGVLHHSSHMQLTVVVAMVVLGIVVASSPAAGRPLAVDGPGRDCRPQQVRLFRAGVDIFTPPVLL